MLSKWLNLKCIMLSEGSLTQKAPYCGIPFLLPSGKEQTYKDGKQMGVGTVAWVDRLNSEGHQEIFMLVGVLYILIMVGVV